MTEHLTPEQLAAAVEIADRAKSDPFHLSDCEGVLEIWRESALTHVRRDEAGEIEVFSTPSCYRPTDKVLSIDLDSWDPDEDIEDDQRRTDIGDMATARKLLDPLVAEVTRLRAELAARPSRDTARHEAAEEIREKAWPHERPESENRLIHELADLIDPEVTL